MFISDLPRPHEYLITCVLYAFSATGFSGFEHLGYYADQSGGMNYTAHTTAQQRNNYTYGRS